MNIIVEALFLLFSVISLYLAFLFLLLYLENKKKFHKSPKGLKKLPSVSIIVPAYNEEKYIGDTIKALKQLAYPKRLLEIIVVDDGSTDNTYRVTKKFKGIKILRQKNKGKGAALNHGLKHVKGEIVACVDSDSYPMPSALMEAIKYFSNEDVGGVTASIFVKNKERLLDRLQWLEYVMIIWSRKLFEFIESIYVTPGPFSLYRKEALLKVGGFDEEIITEDIEVTWRLLKQGYKIRLANKARVVTRTPDYLMSWWKQRVRWNIGGLQTSIKYKYTIFKKEFGTLGRIVAPFFITSYILSVVGFFLFTYLVSDWVYRTFFFTTRAYAIGVNPFSHYEFIILPDIFTFLGLVVFILSLIWVKLGVGVIDEEKPIRSRMKSFFTIFPINLFYSAWKFFRKSYEW
jgi:biofilm PGA synthesis N-glycosyltransferase PgaC